MDSLQQVKVWNTSTWDELVSWSAGKKITAAAVSPDGSVLATGSDDGTLQLLQLVSGNLLVATNAHLRVITRIDFKRDGAFFATSSEDALVKVWRTSDWGLEAILRSHVLGVHSVCFSPDGSRLVSSSHDKQAIKVWDAVTYRELMTLKGKGAFFNRTAFSSNGKTLVGLNGEGLMHLWTASGY